MPSDELTDPQTAPTSPSGVADRRADRFERERRRRKIIVLAVLVLLLLLLAYSAYYFTKKRSLPFGVRPPATGEIVAPPEYLFSFAGSGANLLGEPLGVAYNDGRVYVVDFRKRIVRVFARDGRFLFNFSKIEGEGGALRNPVHMAIDSKDRVWVTDRRLRGIYVFDRDGKFLFKFAPGGDKKFVWTPLAIAFDPKDNLIVTDVGETTKHQVFVFDPKGKRLAQFGSTVQVVKADESPGGFFFPNGAAGVDDLAFIGDGDNRRVQVFGLKDARFRYFVATSGTPRGLTMDSEKRLYVVDALAHQVDVYDVKGAKIVQFGGQGFGPGQFNFPNDVTVDNLGRIYISDRENNQIQVWQWPEAGPPPLPTPRKPWQWALCLSPLLFFLIPLFRRRRRYTVTVDFVDALVALEEVSAMDERRLEWFSPEARHALDFEGRVEEGIDLGDLIQPEKHSASDAAAIAERLEVDEETSILLSIAKRTKRLCTQDAELRSLALLLSIDVFDAEEFLESRRESRERRS